MFRESRREDWELTKTEGSQDVTGLYAHLTFRLFSQQTLLEFHRSDWLRNE
jgi:hypothetical protein